MIYAIWILALTIFLAVLFALSRARFTIRRIRQSLEEATLGTLAVAEGDLTYRMEATQPDDFIHLAQNFNRMVTQLETTTVSKDRLEAEEAKLREVNAYLAREISERKRAEEQFRLVVESAPSGMLMIDRHGAIVLVNAHMEKLFDYRREELLGRPMEILVPARFRGQHPGHRQKFFAEPMARSMSSGRDLFGLRKDGTEFPVEIGLNPIETPVGTCVLASVVDITERKTAEERVRQSEERFRSMIENIRDYAIFMLDADGHVITWNGGAERIRGYSSEEILGMHFSCFYPPEEIEQGKPQQILKTALAEGLCEDEGWRLRKDGSKFWANIVTTPVRKPEGEILGFSQVTRDLSRRRKAEEELRLAKDQADAANQAKSDFLANISHEIRTPMTGVIGMAGLLMDTELSSKQKEYCEIIRRSGDALLTVINEVLDFSKVESGKLELEIIDFDLRTAVEEVTDLFAKQADDKGVELINLVDYDVPVGVQGDPGRIRQILSNLVSNSLKFTAKGEVVVRVSVAEETSDYANLRFSVTDTGIGIPKEKIGKLFNSFTQVDASTTRKYGGTGLGLAICKKFIELMGGEIGVESEPNQGSTFWFALQLGKQRQHAREAVKPRSTVRGLRVLIVEGNPTVKSVLEHYLSASGVATEHVKNGPAALRLLHGSATDEKTFDLAIIDSMLPGMDGLKLARAIRQTAKLRLLKLLLLTSVAQRGDGKMAQTAGVDAYLAKPVRLSQLLDCIAVVTGNARAAKSTRPLVTRHTLAELKAARRLRILVADDNHINQKVTASLLKKMGHRADVVGNGKEALDAFKLVPYDAVLMDMQMPEMDGFEASLQIRLLEQQNGGHTPIIAITAHAMKEDRDKCLAAGMDDYISKPIDPKELKMVLERRTNLSEVAPVIAAATKTSADVLNFAEALAQVEGDRELLCEIIKLFMAQYPKLLEETRNTLSVADWISLSNAAHTLASSAGQVGAQRAHAAAKKLEQLSRDGIISEVPAALNKLEQEIVLLNSALSDPTIIQELPFQSPPLMH